MAHCAKGLTLLQNNHRIDREVDSSNPIDKQAVAAAVRSAHGHYAHLHGPRYASSDIARSMPNSVAVAAALVRGASFSLPPALAAKTKLACVPPIPRLPPKAAPTDPPVAVFLSALFSTKPFQPLFHPCVPEPSTPLAAHRRSLSLSSIPGLKSTLDDEGEHVNQNPAGEIDDDADKPQPAKSLQVIRSAIQTFQVSSDPSSVLQCIRGLYSSIDAAIHCFQSSDAIDANDDFLRVDLAMIQECYQDLLHLEPRHVFTHALTNSLQLMIAHVEEHRPVFESRLLCPLIVAFECPLLWQSELGNDSLRHRVVALLGSLSANLNVCLRQFMATMDMESLTRWVVQLRSIVSTCFHSNNVHDARTINAVKLLEQLFAVVTHSYDLQGRYFIDPSLFYCHEFAGKLDFKRTYADWQASRATKTAIFNFFDYPFIFSPASKSRILHIDAVMQMSQLFERAYVYSAWVWSAQRTLERDLDEATDAAIRRHTCPYLVLEIRRETMIADALAQLHIASSAELKKPLKITFVDGGEIGLDLGGVSKDFFQTIIAQVFDPAFGMFIYDEATRTFWFNSSSFENNGEFALVGKLIGLAIYNGVILDIHFPQLIWKKLLGGRMTIYDLSELRPQLARSLKDLLTFDGDVEDVFCQTMSVPASSFFAADASTANELCIVPLIENGEHVPVTRENREQYVDLYVQYLLVDSVAAQFSAFAEGFLLVCGGPVLSMCLPQELELLVCGSPTLDMHQLELSATYDGYTVNDRIIQQFWRLAHSMSTAEQRQLLVFVTASDRVPVQGVGKISFVIQRNGSDDSRLPTSLTCFNRLLLPDYSTSAILAERLRKAIEHGAGFGLV